jgi:hypothetical protein
VKLVSFILSIGIASSQAIAENFVSLLPLL